MAGFLWSEFAEIDDGEEQQNWPLGASLTWNVFGIVCLVAFAGSCWLRKPPKRDRDEAENDVESQ